MEAHPILPLLTRVAQATGREVEIIEIDECATRYAIIGPDQETELDLATVDEILGWCTEHERCCECESDAVTIEWNADSGEPPRVKCGSCGWDDGEFHELDVGDLVECAERIAERAYTFDAVQEAARGHLLRIRWAESFGKGRVRLTLAGIAAVAAYRQEWGPMRDAERAIRAEAVDAAEFAVEVTR